jgi:hypothetical protein
MKMRSNILLHCDQKIQKENRKEIKIMNKYYKIYILRRKQKGKRKINKKDRARTKKCGYKMALLGVRTYEYIT